MEVSKAISVQETDHSTSEHTTTFHAKLSNSILPILDTLSQIYLPFQSFEIAKLYLRTADYSRKTTCGIYEIRSQNGRAAYKIFASDQDLELYLKKNKGKNCNGMAPVFRVEEYKEYPNTQIRKLTSDEIQKYMTER